MRYGEGVSGWPQGNIPLGGTQPCLGGEAEALAIAGGTHAQPAMKGAAQDLGAGEAGGPGDRLQRLSAVLEQVAGAFDAQCLDVGGRGLADFGSEGAGERALAEAGAVGQRRDREVLVEMPGDPRLQITQRRPRGLLDRQGAAELRLAAGTLEEHDQ